MTKIRTREPFRRQGVTRFEIAEDSLPEGHRARLLWQQVETRDLSAFTVRAKSIERGLAVAALALTLFGSGGCGAKTSGPHLAAKSAAASTRSCFLLYELGVGEVRRSPSSLCATRVTPASTFKIPHALAALDSGVVASADERFSYDGSPVTFPTWQRDHTLASAMKYSVVWYFQRIATKLGREREAAYLAKLDYGNRDSSSGLTFWIEGSLAISPDEQERFLVSLFRDELPVSKESQRVVRELLVQPAGVVVNATGEHAFVAPWPEGTVLRAKTGSASNRDGSEVRWLVGDVERRGRSWVFVSCVVGGGTLEARAALDLAADALRRERVL